MKLPVRPKEYILPSYTLTGDLLGFLRCGLQYRYHVVGKLPPANPVQMWFGQFIHGVLEESYRRYNNAKQEGKNLLPPWPEEELKKICKLIKDRLAIQRLFPWDDKVEETGIKRAIRAVNEMGPELFPLINQAEVRLSGARELPEIPSKYRFREAERYEMAGVVDVITHIELNNPKFRKNKIVQSIINALPNKLPGSFEIIIDYKGMRRPRNVSGGTFPSLWEQHEWQIQTYAHLRQAQQGNLPVVAGVLIYVNELLPSKTDLRKLKKEIKEGKTDVCPAPGTLEEKLIKKWNSKEVPPELPYSFRLQRAMHVVPVNNKSIQDALDKFNKIVERIETCHGKERVTGDVINSWEKNNSDRSTCTACDAKTFCPVSPEKGIPKLPAWKK